MNDNHSIWHHKVTPGSGFITGLLVLALVALGERVLWDLARVFGGEPLNYFKNLDIIIVHSFFILPLLIVCILVNVLLREGKQKYAIVLIPYFVLSIVLALQLALQVAVYFTNHHTTLEFYIVMSLMALICTVAIYYIQDRYVPKN
jgi:hypothetical protein